MRSYLLKEIPEYLFRNLSYLVKFSGGNAMRSYLLKEIPDHLAALAVEGYHKPGSLTQASGAWIHSAGSFVLEKGTWPLNPHEQWVWLAVEKGNIILFWDNHELALSAGSTCFLPGGDKRCEITTEEDTRCLWIALEGPLSPMVVRKMGALLHMPLRQGALPSQIYLAEQIVQVIVRHSGTADATYQLQHLLYGMIASHWGQPVAMDAMLSHFRKRFVAEVGMPPLSYVLHCKMERAKELLRDQNCSVRQAGVEVGMQDPYHFSKQFKHIVGISPSAFMKQASVPSATIRGVTPKVKKK